MPLSKPVQMALPGQSRIQKFMRSFGLENSHDLAQAFRVSQTTAARWMKDAETKPVEDVMPGPAFILLGLMENGVETEDLRRTQALAALREHPSDQGPVAGEDKWQIEIPRFSRHGVKIVTGTGHYIVAHSGWFKERIKKLAAGQDDALARKLMQRYTDAINKLAGLPR